MRHSYQALPTWLSRVEEVAPTPVAARRPPDDTVLRRALTNSRLPLHVVLVAVLLGIGAAGAAGAVRARDTAASQAEMSAFATRKAAELSAFGILRSAPARALGSPLAPGGSVTEDVPGYFDLVEGTEGRRFRRRWAVEVDPTGHKRVAVRIIPATREAGRVPFDLATLVPHP